MPIAWIAQPPALGFAPVLDVPFTIGADAANGLVVQGPAVAPQHASLRYTRGEYLLVADDGATVYVNGTPAPMLALHDGDEVRWGQDGPTLVFRNGLEGCYRPPEASLTEAWLALPASREPDRGTAAWPDGPSIGGRDPLRCRRSGTGDDALVVKRFGGIKDPAAGDEHLRLLARWGGAPHPAVTRLVDGGIEVVDDTPQRWAVSTWVEGRSARDLVEAGGVTAEEALRILQDLAAGLAHLHRRGIVHRDVAPGNVIQRDDGHAVLIDLGQAVPADAAARPSAGVVGTPGYVAPEEVLAGREAVSPAVDCYGLGAVGYALLTGMPPASGEDLLATLGQATQPPPPLRDYGVTVPDVLEATLLQCLHPDPAQREDADTIVASLAFAGAQVGLGGHA